MRIEATTRLDGAQKELLHRLENACNTADGTAFEIFASNVFNVYPQQNAFYFCLEGETALGMLNVYADSPDLAELTVLVAPQYRRRGVCTELLAAATQELEHFGYRKVRFKTDEAFAPAAEILQRRGFVPDGREYLMVAQPGAAAPQGSVTVRLAQEADVEALAALQGEAFGEEPETARRYVKETLAGSQQALYVAEEAGRLAGCASVDLAGRYAYVYGLCVAADMRGRGVGKAMLRGVLAQQTRLAALHVEAGNAAALRLYEGAGFRRQAVQAYWLGSI